MFGRILNYFVNMLRIWPTIMDIMYTQSGFKMFKADVSKILFDMLTLDVFSFDIELLFLSRQLGYKVAEFLSTGLM